MALPAFLRALLAWPLIAALAACVPHGEPALFTFPDAHP
jgi:hypothetical protein